MSELCFFDTELYDPSLALLCCTYVAGTKHTVTWGISYLESEADFRDRLFDHVKQHGPKHLDWIYIIMPYSPLSKELVSYDAALKGTSHGDECGELVLHGATFEEVLRIKQEIHVHGTKVKKPTVDQFEKWFELQPKEK